MQVDAQTPAENEKASLWSYGVEAGLNMSRLDCNEVEDYFAGAIAVFKLNKYFKDRPNTFFLSVGAGLSLDRYIDYSTRDSPKEPLEESYKINPISLYVPLNIGYRFKVADQWSVFAEGGPYMKLGLWGWGSDVGYHHISNIYAKSERMIKRFDYGLMVGAGVTFRQHYRLSFHYNYGLPSLCDIDGNYLIGDVRDSFAITLGYYFR